MKLAAIKIKLKIQEGDEFSYQKSSLMQGVLMEWLEPEYVGKLHANSWNPYSQYLERTGEDWYWNICVFDEEAYRQIVPAVMDESRKEIRLKHSRQTIGIVDRQLEVKDVQELMNQFYFQDAPRQISIRFKTPVSFKQNGNYLIFPDIGCTIKSMIHKYEAVTTGETEIDEAILQELTENMRIIQYQLKSTTFHLEGVRIPSFMGTVKIHMKGSQTLVNYVHFLFRFACYSGIGIKSSMGMGAIEILERKEQGVK